MNEQQPEFGPRGYLPPRAARRARKIVLREPLSLGWPLAAVAAGLLLLVVGVVYLLRGGPPGPPLQFAAPLDAVGVDGAAHLQVDGEPVLVVRAGGRFAAFTAPGETVTYCPQSRRLESPSGSVWTLDGALVGGPGTSLALLPAVVSEGDIYVDPHDPAPPAGAVDRGETPTCAA